MVLTVNNIRPQHVPVNGEKCKLITVNGVPVWRAELELVPAPELWSYGECGVGDKTCTNDAGGMVLKAAGGANVNSIGNGGWYRTAELIDLTDYATLTVDVSAATMADYATWATCKAGVTDAAALTLISESTGGIVDKTPWLAEIPLGWDGAATYTLDVSGITGAHYIVFAAMSHLYSASVTIGRAWLE